MNLLISKVSVGCANAIIVIIQWSDVDMLVNMKGILADAAKGGYAVGGFNFASLESGMGAIRASEELGIPFVL